MNLSGDEPATINQVKFIMHGKWKPFCLCNEPLPCRVNGIRNKVKSTHAPYCCSHLLSHQCQRRGVSGLLWSLERRYETVQPEPPPPVMLDSTRPAAPSSLRCGHAGWSCGRMDWIDRGHLTYSSCYLSVDRRIPKLFDRNLLTAACSWQ